MFAKIERILDNAAAGGNSCLSEQEAYAVFELLGLTVPARFVVAKSEFSTPGLAKKLAALKGEKVVLKILSSKTLHKTESGGVKVCQKKDAEAAVAQFAGKFSDIDGVLALEFVEHAVFALGQELMLGARADKGFGPLITLGVGGTDAEHMTSVLKAGYSPAIRPVLLKGESWKEFLSRAWIWKYVSGNVRGGKKLAEDAEILKWLEAFEKLVSHFSDGGKSKWAVEEVEVNPLAVSGGRLVALDGVLRFRKAASFSRVSPSAKAVWSLAPCMK